MLLHFKRWPTKEERSQGIIRKFDEEGLLSFWGYYSNNRDEEKGETVELITARLMEWMQSQAEAIALEAARKKQLKRAKHVKKVQPEKMEEPQPTDEMRHLQRVVESKNNIKLKMEKRKHVSRISRREQQKKARTGPHLPDEGVVIDEQAGIVEVSVVLMKLKEFTVSH